MQDVKVSALRLIIIPMFTKSLLANETSMVDKETLRSIMKDLLMGESSDLSYSESLRIELLHLSTVLIRFVGQDMMDHRKELIKFAWNHLKSDDLASKQWAYVNVCQFIEVYETPPKIILQVFVALLRTFQSESASLGRKALCILTPALPKRLQPRDLVKAVKWTKKIVYEDGHTTSQLIYIWTLITRHPAIFFPFRGSFLHRMIMSLSRLGLPPNCPFSNRRLAIDLAHLIIVWEERRREMMKARSREVNSVRGLKSLSKSLTKKKKKKNQDDDDDDDKMDIDEEEQKSTKTKKKGNKKRTSMTKKSKKGNSRRRKGAAPTFDIEQPDVDMKRITRRKRRKTASFRNKRALQLRRLEHRLGIQVPEHLKTPQTPESIAAKEIALQKFVESKKKVLAKVKEAEAKLKSERSKIEAKKQSEGSVQVEIQKELSKISHKIQAVQNLRKTQGPEHADEKKMLEQVEQLKKQLKETEEKANKQFSIQQATQKLLKQCHEKQKKERAKARHLQGEIRALTTKSTKVRREFDVTVKCSETTLTSKMADILANFLVRITFITTATDHAQYMTKRCLNLLQRTMTLWPSAHIRIEHFQKLFQRGSSSSSSDTSSKASSDDIKNEKKTTSSSSSSKSASTKSSSPSPRMQYTCVQVLDAILRTGTNHFVQDHTQQFVTMLAPCFDIRAPEMQSLLQVFFSRLVLECSKGRRENLRQELIVGMYRVLARAVRDTNAGRGERAYIAMSMMSRLETTAPGFIRDGERHTELLIFLFQNLSKLHVRLTRQKLIEQNFNPPSSSSSNSSSSSRGRKPTSSTKSNTKKKGQKSNPKSKKGSSSSSNSAKNSSRRQRGSRVAQIIKALKLVDRSLLKCIRLLTPRCLTLSKGRIGFFRILGSLLRKSNSSTLISAILISMNRWVKSSAQCRLEDKLKRHENLSNAVPSRVRSEMLGLSQSAEGMVRCVRARRARNFNNISQFNNSLYHNHTQYNYSNTGTFVLDRSKR